MSRTLSRIMQLELVVKTGVRSSTKSWLLKWISKRGPDQFLISSQTSSAVNAQTGKESRGLKACGFLRERKRCWICNSGRRI
ncbi:unnamed protein product [Allacma fusca]|uniref:Uncharacterized protein n=1 Tax=Allacma fusca TaxID=39272 RepID=A0A8J2KR86_9HEXA|nr:unnamed protein product [Allacma fusca]